MTNAILPEVEKYIAAQILKQPSRKIVVDEPLISSGLIDSFSLMDLALFVEDTFGVRIEDHKMILGKSREFVDHSDKPWVVFVFQK